MSIQKLRSLGVKLLSALPDPDSLNGMGSRRLAALKRAGIFDVADLLLTLPRDYEDRRSPRGLATLYEGEGSARVFNRVQVLRVEYFYARRRRTPRIWIEDDGGRAVLLCFGRPFLAEKLRPGSSWLLAGTFALRKGELQSSSFELVPADGNGNGDGDGDGAGGRFFLYSGAVLPHPRHISGCPTGFLCSGPGQGATPARRGPHP